MRMFSIRLHTHAYACEQEEALRRNACEQEEVRLRMRAYADVCASSCSHAYACVCYAYACEQEEARSVRLVSGIANDKLNL